jgi:hypothetical protein
MSNSHLSILIRDVQTLSAEARHQLYAEMKLHHNQNATFQLGEETVIAVIGITEHQVTRLEEHYKIDYTSATREKK